MDVAYYRAKKICSSKEKSKCRIDRVKFISWNGYPLVLVILLSSDLQAILTQIEIKRQATKRRLSGLDYLTFDM